jgi:hypothetical protein
MFGEHRPERRLTGLMTSVSMAAAGQALAAPAGSSPGVQPPTENAVLRSDLNGLYASYRRIPGRDIAALMAAASQQLGMAPNTDPTITS